MNCKDIESTLKKIMEIDVKATTVEKGIEEMKVIKDKELKKELKDIEFAIMKDVRKTAKNEREELMEKAKSEREIILKDGEQSCEKMKKILNNHIDELVEEIIKNLACDGRKGV